MSVGSHLVFYSPHSLDLVAEVGLALSYLFYGLDMLGAFCFLMRKLSPRCVTGPRALPLCPALCLWGLS